MNRLNLRPFFLTVVAIVSLLIFYGKVVAPRLVAWHNAALTSSVLNWPEIERDAVDSELTLSLEALGQKLDQVEFDYYRQANVDPDVLELPLPPLAVRPVTIDYGLIQDYQHQESLAWCEVMRSSDNVLCQFAHNPQPLSEDRRGPW